MSAYCKVITHHCFYQMYLFILLNYIKQNSFHLTHWGWVTHICIGILTSNGSDNGLLPGPRQAIIWTNAGIVLIEPLETNSVKFYSEFKHFHSRKCIWKCHLENGVHFSRPQCVNTTKAWIKWLTFRNLHIQVDFVLTILSFIIVWWYGSYQYHVELNRNYILKSNSS